MSAYADLIASTPLPSEEQTERFAADVFAAQEWREGLRLAAPERRIVFFLDPAEERIHSLPPKLYRERFGCWDYGVLCGLPPFVAGPHAGVPAAVWHPGSDLASDFEAFRVDPGTTWRDCASLSVRGSDGLPVVVPQRVISHCGLLLPEDPSSVRAESVRAALAKSRQYVGVLRALAATLARFSALAALRGVLTHQHASSLLRALLDAPDRETYLSLRGDPRGWGVERGTSGMAPPRFRHRALRELFTFIDQMEFDRRVGLVQHQLGHFFVDMDEAEQTRAPRVKLFEHRDAYEQARAQLAAIAVGMAPWPDAHGELPAGERVAQVLASASSASGWGKRSAFDAVVDKLRASLGTDPLPYDYF